MFHNVVGFNVWRWFASGRHSIGGVKDRRPVSLHVALSIGSMISAPPNRQARAIPAFDWIPAAAGLFTAVVGVLVLIGWWRDIDALRTIIPGLIPTIPNTAVAAFVGGLAVLSALREERDPRFGDVTRVLGSILTALGAIFIIERVAKIDLGIDLLLFGNAVRAMEWEPPGRPALNSAIVMLVDGVALLLIEHETRRGRRPAELLSAIGTAISFVAIVGYMYGVRGLYSLGPRTGMALLTAITLCMLSVGILFARPNQGVASIFAAGDSSGAMVRRLVPPALIVPIGLGALWLLARDANWVTREAGVSAFVAAVVLTFLLLVMRAAAVVRRADAERDELLHRAESARAVAERAADRTNRLRRTAEALSGALTPIAVARVIVSEGLPALSATASEVAILTPDGVVLDLMAVSGLPAEVADAWRRFPVTSRVPLADAVRGTEAVLLRSPDEIAQRYPDLAPVLERVNVRAMIVTPMLVDGRALGSLSFSFNEPRSFDESDTTFTRTLGQQCAQALERSRLFAAEQSARSDAEAANRAKTEFLAMMSHELRTPLNAIAGYTELMELGISGPVSEMQREQLGRIRRSQRHLLGIIEDLLDLSRLEHGVPADIELGPVPVHETLGGLEALIAPQLKARNLTYIYNPAEGALMAYGNRARVEQIVLNLLSNAVKYTSPGGRIGLSSGVHAGRVEIRVSDTGHGIPREKLDSIFEPFTRLEMDLTRTTEGTGLGLAISRHLARAMMGDLTARSEVGRGSIFTLTLPIEAPIMADQPPVVTPPASMIAVPANAIPLHRVRM
jgi:signal transduction histidine kinase